VARTDVSCRLIYLDVTRIHEWGVKKTRTLSRTAKAMNIGIARGNGYGTAMRS
jgi:hypothetical protein